MVILQTQSPLLLPEIRTDRLDRHQRVSERAPGSKLRNHIACQTDASELLDLQAIQQKFAELSLELANMNVAMRQTEQRIRHEMQSEADARIQMHSQKCAEKIAFLKERAENHMASVRASSKIRMTQEVLQCEKRIGDQLESQRRTIEELQAANSNAEKEFKALHTLAMRCRLRLRFELAPRHLMRLSIPHSRGMPPRYRRCT